MRYRDGPSRHVDVQARIKAYAWNTFVIMVQDGQWRRHLMYSGVFLL